MSGQVPSEGKSLKELYEDVCEERGRLRDELRESRRREREELQEELQGKRNDAENFSARLSAALEQNQELRKRLRASEGDLASVKSENASLHQRLEQTEQDKTSASSSEIGTTTSIDQAHDLAKGPEEREKLRRQVKEGDRALVRLSSQLERAKTSKAELKRTLRAHLRDNMKNSEALAALHAQLLQSLENLSSAKEEKEALGLELERLKADHRSLKAELAEIREEKDSLSKRLELDLARLRADHRSLEAKLAAAREEKDGLCKRLERAEGDKSILEESKAAIENRMAAAEDEREKERGGTKKFVLKWEESLKAVEREKHALLERNSALEKQRDETEAEKESLGGELSAAKERLEALEAQRSSLVESNAILVERAAESEKRMEKERSDLARLLLESEQALGAAETERNALLEENGGLKDQNADAEARLETVEAQKSSLEKYRAILGEQAAESERRMEKERSNLARLLLESEKSLKAVVIERNALLEENCRAEADAEASRTWLCEQRALSRGLEEEKTLLIKEKRKMEKEFEKQTEEERNNQARLLLESEKSLKAVETEKEKMEKEFERRMEKERSNNERLLLESEKSLKAVEAERNALLEEKGRLSDRMWEEEKARLIEEKRKMEEQSNLAHLLLESKKSLKAVETERNALLEEKGRLNDRGWEEEKVRLIEEKEKMEKDFEECMEKERSNMEGLLLESEKSLKAVETERNALLEANCSLNDRRAEAETDAEASRTWLCEQRALSRGLEEEKALLIKEKRKMEKEFEKRMEEERNNQARLLLESGKSLKAVETERNALLKENRSLNDRRGWEEEKALFIEEKRKIEKEFEKRMEGERSNLERLLLESKKSLKAVETERTAFLEEKGSLNDRRGWEEEKTRLIEEKREMEKEFEKRMEEERNNQARLLLESEKSLKAVETERNALLEGNDGLNDRRGWEEEKARLIEEKRKMEKEKKILRERVRILAGNRESMFQKLLKDALEVTTIGDDKENSENTKLPEGGTNNKESALRSNAESPLAPPTRVPPRPPLTPTGSMASAPSATTRGVAVDP